MMNINLHLQNYYLCYEIYDILLLSFENGTFLFFPAPFMEGQILTPTFSLSEPLKFASEGFKILSASLKNFSARPCVRGFLPYGVGGGGWGIMEKKLIII